MSRLVLDTLANRPSLSFINFKDECRRDWSCDRGSTACVLGNIARSDGCLLVILGASPMTCHSSESTETIENGRRTDTESVVVDSDENRIARAMKDLKNTGWYWGSLTANEAKEILQDASEGTFLVRDSSQRDYLFTISAMTSAGPTNLRIEYKEGKFKLDSVVLVKPKLKQFDSVVHLVEHYVQLSRTTSKGASSLGASQPLGPPNGTVQLLLTKPVYTAAPSLQHLCRISINKATRQVQGLPLPNRLKDYLVDYSYNV
ncbi:suppressor of cytokine signaling 2 isoform X1 [Esox lucius]|uniref:Suppressor of cytokine signaling 2 n=2 Tax=Esox lucius TaxID=8010 RepID=A0AAY5JVV7_ESOLU|nr:suppressor of cytokine signaling 2 isoform X1 [Esox lucius]